MQASRNGPVHVQGTVSKLNDLFLRPPLLLLLLVCRLSRLFCARLNSFHGQTRHVVHLLPNHLQARVAPCSPSLHIAEVCRALGLRGCCCYVGNDRRQPRYAVQRAVSKQQSSLEPRWIPDGGLRYGISGGEGKLLIRGFRWPARSSSHT